MASSTFHSPLPLDHLPASESSPLALLRRRGQPRVAAAGQVILSEGRHPPAIYVVEAGAIALAVTGRSGNRIVLGILGPGDVFGEQALTPEADAKLAGDPRPLLPEARAILLCRFVVVPAEEPAEANPDDREFSRWLAAALARRVDEAHRTLARSLSLPLGERTLGLLSTLAQRWGRPSGGGTTIRFPLKQDDLAAMLGATRESVNRVVRELERGGAITRSGRSYAVRPARTDPPGRSEPPVPRPRA